MVGLFCWAGLLAKVNFVDRKEVEQNQDENIRNFRVPDDSIQGQVTRVTGEIARPLVSDNNEPNPGGRPRQDDQELRDKGTEMRRKITSRLATMEMKRPLQHNMKYNQYGHIYMTS